MLNPHSLTSKEIQTTKSAEKIASLLTHFGIVRTMSKKRINTINKYLSHMRNEILHFGKIPRRRGASKDARMFVELTAYLVAVILELPPSNGMNVLEHLQQLLNR